MFDNNMLDLRKKSLFENNIPQFKQEMAICRIWHTLIHLETWSWMLHFHAKWKSILQIRNMPNALFIVIIISYQIYETTPKTPLFSYTLVHYKLRLSHFILKCIQLLQKHKLHFLVICADIIKIKNI